MGDKNTKDYNVLWTACIHIIEACKVMEHLDNINKNN